jgi:hypothetical protein
MEPQYGHEPELSKSSIDYAQMLADATEPESQEKHSESINALGKQLTELACIVPELTERHLAIEASGAALIEQYGLKKEMFESPERTLVFLGLAARRSKQMYVDIDASEATYIDDSMLALAHNYSDELGVRWTMSEERHEPPPEEAMRVYDRYTDRQLSEVLTKAINSGSLTDVKTRLGLTSENEVDFEIRVLTISGDGRAHGLRPKFPEQLPKEFRELQPVLDDYEVTRKQVRDWEAGLKERGNTFATEMGADNIFAEAWVSHIGDKQLLCLASPLAEKLLDRSLTENASYYDNETFTRDWAILEHEFTHTQGGVLLDEDVNFGINVEELRAEHFSGNNQGYQDIKGLFLDYTTLTGQSLTDIMAALPKGGEPIDVYSSIANQVGVESMVELLQCSPKNYFSAQSNPHNRAAFEHIGGYDGVLTKIHAGIEDQASIQSRIQMRADRVNEVAARTSLTDYPMSTTDLLSWRRKFGLNYVTDLVQDKVAAS